MAFFAREAGVAVEGCVEVARKDVLDFTCSNYVFWPSVWKLYPIVKQVGGDPENKFVNACASDLKVPIFNRFFSFGKDSSGNPVVILKTINLSAQVKAVGSTHDS